MEDFILREIDRLGEMLLMIARKLGLLDGDSPEQENPVWYLVETEKITDHSLETFIDILFHSDMEEDRKAALLDDALAYLDGKGYFSFRLHSLSSR